MSNDYDPIQMCDLHNKRISRVGIKMWDFMRTLHKKERISGLDATHIMDYYGIRPSDVMFLCATHGCDVDTVDFCKELNSRTKKISVQCVVE